MSRLAQKSMLMVAMGLIAACSNAATSSNPFKQGSIYNLESVTQTDNVRTISNGELLFAR